MRTRANRRYPRVPVEQTAELEARVGGSRESFPITIRSLSCEGCGVEFRAERRRVPAGTHVTVRFGDRELGRFELPGRVAWIARDGADGPFDLGVRFHLELAQLQMRQTYARWIVSLIQSFQGLSGNLAIAATLELNGLPFSSIGDELSAIPSVTKGDLNKLAMPSIPLEQAVLVLVGDKKTILDQIRGLGLPTPVELSVTGDPVAAANSTR